MTHDLGLVAAIVCMLWAMTAVRADEPADQVPQAVARSLPFLDKEGTAWMTARKCIACHHVPYLIWTHQEATARGFTIDRQKLQAWTDWSLAFYAPELPWFKLAAIALLRSREVPPDDQGATVEVSTGEPRNLCRSIAEQGTV